MSEVKRQALWNRKQTLTAGEATVLGAAIGSAAAIVAALTPLRDFSYIYLSVLVLSIGPCAGIAGYMFWLAFDPVREQRLRRITSIVAFPTIIGLHVAFPAFWREMGRSMGMHMVWNFVGFIFATTAFAVAAGLGLAHLVGHVRELFRGYRKSGAAVRTNGVRDRELDQG